MSRSDTMRPTELLARFDAVTLDELDAKAALQRRVDNKYVLSWAQLADLFDGLRPRMERVIATGFLPERASSPCRSASTGRGWDC